MVELPELDPVVDIPVLRSLLELLVLSNILNLPIYALLERHEHIVDRILFRASIYGMVVRRSRELGPGGSRGIDAACRTLDYGPYVRFVSF